MVIHTTYTVIREAISPDNCGGSCANTCGSSRPVRRRTDPRRTDRMSEQTGRIELLRTTQATHDDWYKRIGSTCFAYNSTPHATTNFAPFYLMFGCEPITDIDARLPPGYRAHAKPTNVHARQLLERLETAHVTARRHLRQAAESRKRYYDRDIDTGRHTRHRYSRKPTWIWMWPRRKANSLPSWAHRCGRQARLSRC